MLTKKTFLMLLALVVLTAKAANTKTTVGQVTANVTLTTDVDYIVNGETPFADDVVVDIANTDHAVLIVERVKPSKLIASLLAKHVTINGQAARNGVNCQVRLYGTRGSMILPYAGTFKPLTVYSEQNFGGESCSDFGLENDGGYMVTLTDKKLNNRIRSFRLKRGYMVTFATQKSGYGYQRCFIANSEDLEMASLPQILDEKITSYRIFKWNTAGKKGLASSTNADACDALNVISCYDWGVGHDMNPDVECVANHLYEDWPSSAACGQATWTCHMKTNNEPRNGSDDKPQSLGTILANWQNLMRTGMRLCSPSSWDGSDYTDGSGFIKQFLDSIDARGWRCDLVDLHCYWLIDNFNNLGAMHSKYKRPLWISEWFWGSSWNKNGAFESGKTDGDIAWGVEQIYNKLNSYGYVERYFYWNSESKGKLYNNGSLTQAGKKYASMLSGMGYNKSYEKVPDTPPMRGGFRDFRVKATGDAQARITWHDFDGEYNQLMEVLRKLPGKPWQTWQTVKPEDAEADYALVDNDYADGTRYRLHIRSFSGRDYWSSEDMEPGEAIETASGMRYVGGNLVANGDFQMGLDGWTDGTGQPLGQPWFEVMPKQLTDGYFLQCLANTGQTGVGSIRTAFDVEPNQDYVIRVAMKNAGEYIKVDLRQKGSTTDENKATLISDDYWSTKQAVFNSGNNNEAVLSFRWLAGTAQLADIELRKLFVSEKEALANGELLSERRNEQLKPYIAAREQLLVDSLLTVARVLVGMNFEGREALQAAIEAADCEQLQKALEGYLVMEEAPTQPKSPSFETADGWLTKAGTFTEGDQRTATQQGKTCWNAWWSGLAASEAASQTMEIRQRIGGLPEGLYSLECKASTQHYCLSDQHGFIRVEKSENSENSEYSDYSEYSDPSAPLSLPLSAETPFLQRDYLDIPGTISAWQTLTTTPVYVSGAATDTLVIGFASSKQGATDYAWRRYGNGDVSTNKGDQREGWWCATDFRLLYHPVYRFSLVPNQWGAVCLPYAYRIPEGMKLYRIAGLLSDYQQLCLEEVSETEPGMPYIYQSAHSDVVFFAAGEAARSAGRGDNNLRGHFISYSQAPLGSYLLKDGVWCRISEREPMTNYSAIITKVDGMTILESWDGTTMPILGAADELRELGIGIVTTAPSSARYFDLQGRPVGEHPSQKGIYVKRNAKRFVK